MRVSVYIYLYVWDILKVSYYFGSKCLSGSSAGMEYNVRTCSYVHA